MNPNLPVDTRPGLNPQVNVFTRVIAKLIDLVLIIGTAAIVAYPFGPLLAFIYSLIADGFPFPGFQGQSIGKKLLKLKVVRVDTELPAQFHDSVIRNAPVGLATFFAIIPVWGWLILILVGTPLMVLEVYLIATAPTGYRLGDVMADTKVVPLPGPPIEETAASYPG